MCSSQFGIEINRLQTEISRAQKECVTAKEELAAVQKASESVDSVFPFHF